MDEGSTCADFDGEVTNMLPYTIEEIGYRDANGVDHMKQSDVDEFEPYYYKWSSGWIRQGDGLVLSDKRSDNKLMVENHIKTGSLNIVKALSLSDGATLETSPVYSFTVNDGTNYYYLDGSTLKSTRTAPTTASDAGVVSVTANDKTGVTLTGLPTGAYTVTEVFIDGVAIEGYAYTGTTMNGEERTDNAITVEVKDNAIVTVTANNSYKRGKLQVSKSFSGITALPDTFVIKANWTGLEDPIELKISGSQSEGVTLEINDTGTTPVYTWTLNNLPIGTEVTFTEEGYGVAGYVWTGMVSVNGETATEGNSGTVAVVAEPAINSVSFANTYVPGAELPATGGTGTLLYTITGIFLITLAGTPLVARKRKANR